MGAAPEQYEPPGPSYSSPYPSPSPSHGGLVGAMQGGPSPVEVAIQQQLNQLKWRQMQQMRAIQQAQAQVQTQGPGLALGQQQQRSPPREMAPVPEHGHGVQGQE